MKGKGLNRNEQCGPRGQRQWALGGDSGQVWEQTWGQGEEKRSQHHPAIDLPLLEDRDWVVLLSRPQCLGHGLPLAEAQSVFVGSVQAGMNECTKGLTGSRGDRLALPPPPPLSG